MESRQARLDRINNQRKELREPGIPIRLSPGFGSVRYIGGTYRRRPYAVHPPAEKISVFSDGKQCAFYRRQKALCYTSDRLTGIVILCLYHLGLYEHGLEQLLFPDEHDGNMEGRREKWQRLNQRLREIVSLEGHAADGGNVFPTDVPGLMHMAMEACVCLRCKGAEHPAVPPVQQDIPSAANTDVGHKLQEDESVPLIANADASHQLLKNTSVSPIADAAFPSPANQKALITFLEGYERYMQYRGSAAAPRKAKEDTLRNLEGASKKLLPVFDRAMDELTVDELQELVNGIQMSGTIVSRVFQIIRSTYEYCYSRGLCSRNPALYLKMPETRPVKHIEDFTDQELKILWSHADRPVTRMILIMCYSGFRIEAYTSLQVHLKEGYFQGGIKTDSSKNRIVPIHSLIRSFVEEAVARDQGKLLLGLSSDSFRHRFYRELKDIGIDSAARHHSPHSTRHTFNRLCESHGVREPDQKRLMGHSFGGDITNGVYGHRTLNELRHEIEKLQKPE